MLEPSSRTVVAVAGLQLPGIGSATVRKALLSVRPGFDFGGEIEQWAIRHFRVSATQWSVAMDAAERAVESAINKQINVVSLGDQAYPSILASTADPPPVLYGLGDWNALACKAVAVVGMRAASDAGLRWAHRIAKTLTEDSFCIVSGLAIGIDTAAHNGALDGGGRTIAVVAQGLDRIAPASNRDLARRIADNKGLILAEHPLDFSGRKHEYVRRNRIQSGLSCASIIVESSGEGGAMSHAAFAAKQGRYLIGVCSNDPSASFNNGGADVLREKYGVRPASDISELLKEVAKAAEQSTATSPSTGSQVDLFS